MTTIGTTTLVGGSTFLLLPSSSKNGNSLTLYKTSNKGNLIIGNSSLKGGNLQAKAKNIIGISKEGWKYKNNNSSEFENSNSFQLTGDEIKLEEKTEDWKTILKKDDSEINKFSGSATFYLSEIDCNDLNKRFAKDYPEQKNVVGEKAIIELYRYDGFVLWSCHEKAETIK